MMRTTLHVAGLMAIVAASAGAQKTCKVDSSAQWFVKQREWLDDSKATWSSDTMRTSLLRAAHIESGKPLSVQMGWELQEDVAPMTMAGESAAIAQLRTLASTHPQFGPAAYHRGAVWPFDSWLGWGGLRAAGNA